MVLISLIFLKNQTRPITNLARAAEKFGKGEEIEEFKPSGASEIRRAGYEFDKMRKKIEDDPKNPKFLQTMRGAGYVLWIK